MEVKVIFLELSPRLPYLKTNTTDFFTISFLQNNSFVKIEDLENYLNKKEPIIIPIMNITQKTIHFYLIKNGINIIGMGEIPLINTTKWFDIKEFTTNKKNREEKHSIISNNKSEISQQIINSYNIKFKISIDIVKNNNEKFNKNLSSLQNTITKDVITDSNSNSISNTCSNSKIPQINKSKDVLSTKNNNILLKNKNINYKKIEMYKKNNSNNCTLFSSINNKLLRNQTEKKLINIANSEKKEKVFSFNDYYGINLKEKDNFPSEKNSCKNMLSLANNKKESKNINNDISIKRKKILKTIEKLSNISNTNDSFKLRRQCTSPKNDILSYKKSKNNSKTKTIIRNIDSWKKNLFWTQHEKKEKEKEKEKEIKKIVSNNN